MSSKLLEVSMDWETLKFTLNVVKIFWNQLMKCIFGGKTIIPCQCFVWWFNVFCTGYLEFTEPQLTGALCSCLALYNRETGQKLDLVFFKEAVHHAARLSRVMVRTVAAMWKPPWFFSAIFSVGRDFFSCKTFWVFSSISHYFTLVQGGLLITTKFVMPSPLAARGLSLRPFIRSSVRPSVLL